MNETQEFSSENISQLPNNIVEQINELLLNTQEQCTMIQQLSESQIKVKDNMIDKLHDELLQYKNDFANRFIVQLMKSIIKVRKDMKKQILSEKWNDISLNDIKREYEYSFEDLTDLLEQQGIDEYQSKIDDDFDPVIHQAKVEFTEEEEKDKKVKQSLSEGYKMGEKVIIPERVIVFKYKKSEEEK